MGDDPKHGQLGLGRHQFLAGRVARCIVDEDDLEIPSVQGLRDFPGERNHISSLIEGRDNNGNFRIGGGGLAHR